MNETVETSAGEARGEETGPVVLQVLPGLGNGGVARGTVDVAIAIAEAGGTPIVVSEGGAKERDLARAEIQHLTLPLASKNPFIMRRNVERLVQMIEELGVDIVHARSRAPAWSAAAAARRSGRHFVTTFHATYRIGNPVRRYYNAIMTKGDRVIAISEFIAEHIRENYTLDPSRLRVIPRGVDLVRFNPDRVSAERMIALATRWRLPDGLPVVMLPGRLTRWKGQTILLKALRHLTDIDFCCVLVGPDEGRRAYRHELEEMIRGLGLSSRAFIVEDCEDMPAAYMLADVVVSASTDPEGFGRVVSEAQAMGRPVAASDHGGAPEQVLRDRTAFLYPPRDARKLAEAIRKGLALDQIGRRHLALEAISNVRGKFTRERMCQQTLQVYDEVLSAGRPGQAG